MSIVIRNDIVHIICDDCGEIIVTVSDLAIQTNPEEKDYCIDCELRRSLRG